MRYKRIKIINVGAFGRVSLVWDMVTKRYMAMKELHVIDEENKVRFKREARILIDQADNPHIVRIHDVDFSGEVPFIVMEYFPKGSLAGKGLLGTDQALQVLKQLALGLAPLHKKGGFHRDIKPHNIMVEDFSLHGWRVKLADFGLARDPVLTSQMSNSPQGTYIYAAPELFYGAKYSDKCDVYSLGVTFVEMVTGCPRLPKQVYLPPRIHKLVDKMVNSNRNVRPAVEEIIAEIDEYFQEKELQELLRKIELERLKRQHTRQNIENLVFGGLMVGGGALLLNAFFGGQNGNRKT